MVLSCVLDTEAYTHTHTHQCLPVYSPSLWQKRINEWTAVKKKRVCEKCLFLPVCVFQTRLKFTSFFFFFFLFCFCSFFRLLFFWITSLPDWCWFDDVRRPQELHSMNILSHSWILVCNDWQWNNWFLVKCALFYVRY